MKNRWRQASPAFFEDIAWIVLAPVSVEHWPQLLGLAMIMLGAMGLLKCLHGAK